MQTAELARLPLERRLRKRRFKKSRPPLVFRPGGESIRPGPGDRSDRASDAKQSKHKACPNGKAWTRRFQNLPVLFFRSRPRLCGWKSPKIGAKKKINKNIGQSKSLQKKARPPHRGGRLGRERRAVAPSVPPGVSLNGAGRRSSSEDIVSPQRGQRRLQAPNSQAGWRVKKPFLPSFPKAPARERKPRGGEGGGSGASCTRGSPTLVFIYDAPAWRAAIAAAAAASSFSSFVRWKLRSLPPCRL